MINSKKVGNQISILRKNKGLTQNELGERLNVTYQAVSKWERGETLPDVSLLVDLANILQTSVDYILTGGGKQINYKGTISVAEIKEGISCLEKMRKLLGKENLIYQSAIEGINTKMNTQIEDIYTSETVFECFVAEAIIQNLMSGYYIDISDVKNNFKSEHFKTIVLDYAAKYGIK